MPMCVFGKAFAHGHTKYQASFELKSEFKIMIFFSPFFLPFLDNQTEIKVKITFLATKHGLTSKIPLKKRKNTFEQNYIILFINIEKNDQTSNEFT